MRDRIELAKYFAELGYRIGAEVGVLNGVYSEQLCQANPVLRLYCIDPWKRHRGYTDVMKLKTFSNAHDRAKKTLAKYDTTLIREFSMDAVRTFPPEFLDFVYLDGNHAFDFIMQDIIEWSKRVKRGGIVSGHDYLTSPKCGVKEAVDIYVEHHYEEITPLTVTDEMDGGGYSWFFRKL